jgi:hypothetical protein
MTRLRNGVGVSISNIPTLSSRRPVAFSPLSLFADGSQGVWYDDSLTSSMFQNGSGLAAALESPVGLQLDLSKGLAVGSELITPAANRDFSSDTGYWTKTAGSITISGGTANYTSASGGNGIYRTGLTTIGTYYQITFTIVSIASGGIYVGFFSTNTSSVFTTAGTYTVNVLADNTSLIFGCTGAGGTTASIANVSLKAIAGNHRYQTTSANRPTLSARYNLLTATATLATQSITTVATSYTIYFTGSGTVTLSGTYIGVFTAGTNTFTATAGTLTATVVGSVLTADIRPTNQTVTLPAYQSVTSSTVYDTVGFPQYLKYNGSNSSLSTASINFTATAQMSAFSGVRKLNDAPSYSAIAELSIDPFNSNGSIQLNARSTFTPVCDYGFASKGTVFSVVGALGYTAPITNILTGLSDIPGDRTTLRVNGTQVAQNTSDQGTGNYGTYPLYFGARAGTSYFFTGQEYQTIIVGKTLTATEISNTETYVNSKTKAY